MEPLAGNGQRNVVASHAATLTRQDAQFASFMIYRLPVEDAAAIMSSVRLQGNILDGGAGTRHQAAAIPGFGVEGSINTVDLSVKIPEQAGHNGHFRTWIDANIKNPLTRN